LTDYIVVEDPTGEWWEGALVDEGRQRQLEARGVVLLPVLPDLFRRSGVGGFHKRAWGAGFPLNASRPGISAPLTIYCSQHFTTMHWAARVAMLPECLEKVKNGDRAVFDGAFVRFIGDASQANPNKCTLNPTVTPDLATLDERTLVDDGFILRGTSEVSFPGDGHYGFALYGTARGLRVVWAAASQA
jgi:hypothetical protein